VERVEYLTTITKYCCDAMQDAIYVLRSICGQETQENQFEELVTNILANQWSAKRIYHNPAHLYYMLMYIDNLYKKQGYFESKFYSDKDQALLTIAVCMHDYVYDYKNKKGQNEKASSNFVKSLLGTVLGSEFFIQRIQELVMLTVDHSNPKNVPMGDILIDADLSILGEPVEWYEQYMGYNYMEYCNAYGDKADIKKFIEGRKNWLKSFLARDSIFMQQEDTIARMNLMWELEEVIEANE